MYFPRVRFSWIPRNNARLKLSCKLGESKCNPRDNILTSHDTNYVLNEHVLAQSGQYAPYAIPSLDDTMLQLSCRFGESNWNPDWVIAPMNSFGTNHVLNDHEDLGPYDLYAMPSQIMLCYTCAASLVNQNEIYIESPCERTHMALIICVDETSPANWMPSIRLSYRESNKRLNLMSMNIFGQYDLNEILSELMPFYCYPAILVNPNEMSIELLW